MEETEEIKKISFWEAQKEAVRSLRIAFQMDSKDAKAFRDNGMDPVNKNQNVKKWLGTGWMYVVIWVLALAMVWSLITPKQRPKRSHHKYDENGRLIY